MYSMHGGGQVVCQSNEGSNSSNDTWLIVVIKEVVVLWVEIVMVMEGTNISPSVHQCWDGAECHCEVLSSRLTGLVINDDRVWSCSSIRRQLYPGSPSLLTARTERESAGCSGSLSLSLCLQNKTLTSTPWLPPLCLTSGHNTEPSASNSDRSVKATQMARTHPSSGPVTQSLLYFST